jgi:hypothetical protein
MRHHGVLAGFTARRQLYRKMATIDHGMLQRVWQELDYRIVVCRVTRGGYMEHL